MASIFCNKTYKDIIQLKRGLIDLWDYVRPKIESSMNPEEPSSVVEALLARKKQIKDESGTPIITDLHVMCAFSDLILAGVATTSRSLYIYINVLLNHPEEMDKIYAEIICVAGKDRAVNLTDRENMPYTRASILELVRFVTVTPCSIPHKTLENTTLRGVDIPKGTTVIANYLALLHDKKLWGDPWVYRPNRYLTEDGSVVPADHPNRKHMLQFGAGPRMCIGEQLALARIFLFLTNLISQYKITRTELEAVSCSPQHYIPGLNVDSPAYKARFISRKMSA